MSRMKQIRQEAPLLLDACKKALIFLRGLEPFEFPITEAKRQATMQMLGDAINTAEPPLFDERLAQIRLTMTHPSWSHLAACLEKRAEVADVEDLLRACRDGHRKTKQRVYLTLPLNPMILKKLLFVLEHMSAGRHREPFARMAAEIKEEGFARNPMEILALAGLHDSSFDPRRQESDAEEALPSVQTGEADGEGS